MSQREAQPVSLTYPWMSSCQLASSLARAKIEVPLSPPPLFLTFSRPYHLTAHLWPAAQHPVLPPAELVSLGFILTHCLPRAWALSIQHTLCSFLLQPVQMLLCFACKHRMCTTDLFPRLLRWTLYLPPHRFSLTPNARGNAKLGHSLQPVPTQYWLLTSRWDIAFLILFLLLIRNSCSVPGVSSHCEHLQKRTRLTPETFQIPAEVSAVFGCLHSCSKFTVAPTTWHLVTRPGLLWAAVLLVCNTDTIYHWNENRINTLQGSGV